MERCHSFYHQSRKGENGKQETKLMGKWAINHLYSEVSPCNKFIKNGLGQGSGDWNREEHKENSMVVSSVYYAVGWLDHDY